MVRVRLRNKVGNRCGTVRLSRREKLAVKQAVLTDAAENNNSPDGKCDAARGDSYCYMKDAAPPPKKYTIQLNERENEMSDEAKLRLKEIEDGIKYSSSSEERDTARDYLDELREQEVLEFTLEQRHAVRDFWERVSSRMN